MNTISRLLLTCLMLVSFALASPLLADEEKRIAFVVGNAEYQAGRLATAANDAGLIAQTLQAAGFDVSGARDLDGESLRAAFRDFLDKAQASGPDTVAFIYLAGYGVQFEGENYFVPVDAKIASSTDVPVEALRVSDYTKRLAGLPLKASFVVLDAARVSPFAKSGQPLAGGLALAEPEPNMLLAFNAAPGTVGPEESGPYGAYAQALAEMIREGGLFPSEIFAGVRMRVSEATKGAEVPWSDSRISAPFVFFERAADAPAPALASDRMVAMSSKPLRDLGAQDAYAAAIVRDSVQGYEDFLAAYPSDLLASRVRALLAARREAITWHRTCRVNTPDAYWSYLRRYPNGPHAAEARWRLEALAVPQAPPASFAPIEYDVPPPPPAEIIYVERPVLILADPAFALPPPPPIVLLAPPPPYLVFTPPLVVAEPFVLPVPVFVPIPAYVDPPRYVAPPPPTNVIFTNIHNTTVTNNIINVINEQRAAAPPGVLVPPTAAAVVAGAAAGAIAAKVAMPPAVARKAAGVRGEGFPKRRPGQAMPSAQPPQKQPPGVLGPAERRPGLALPGMESKPLPGREGKPGAAAEQKPPDGRPGAAQRRPGLALPGMEGRPLPQRKGKAGAEAEQKPPAGPPGAARTRPGRAVPGVEGKPLPEREGKRAPERPLGRLPGAHEAQLGAPAQKEPAPRGLPRGRKLAPPPPAGGVRQKPQETFPRREGQFWGRPPLGQVERPQGFAPPEARSRTPSREPGPSAIPRTQLPQRPRQFQRQGLPPQTYRAPRPAGQHQFFRPPPASLPAGLAPRQAQQWRSPQPQMWRPQAQQWRPQQP